MFDLVELGVFLAFGLSTAQKQIMEPPIMRFSSLLYLFFIFATTLSACGLGTTGKQKHQQCTAGRILVDDVCVKVCNIDADCGSDFLRCQNATCVAILCSEDPCADGVSCTDTETGFECGECPQGFSGNGQTCTDINECSASTSPCDGNASCTNTEGGYRCECDSGFFGDGKVCRPITDCAPGQYEIEAPTATEDRVCSDCPEGTFSSSANATQCDSWAECPAGTHVVTSPSANRNRVCTACESGFFSTAANSAECSPATECRPGTHVLTAATATSDRTCSDCPVGTYSSDANTPQCQSWTECSEGTYVLTEGSASANRTCEPCAAGSYSSIVNAAQCEAWAECAAGTHVVTSAGASQNRVCADCLPGFFSNAVNSDACLPMTECNEGTYVLTEGNASTDRTCEGCAAGSYSSVVNAAQCDDWTVCAAGTRVVVAPSASQNRDCTNCADGTFSTTENAADCAPFQDCADGFEIETNGTPTSDVVCVDIDECTSGALTCAANATCTNTPGSASCGCNSGFFGDGTTTCTAVSNCGVNQYETQAPTSATDRQCSDCAPGSYNDSLNATSCSTDCSSDAECGYDSYGCKESIGKCMPVNRGISNVALLPGGAASDAWPRGCIPLATSPGPGTGSTAYNVSTNIDCTFMNEEDVLEVGRCFYKTDNVNQVECRRTCDPNVGSRCTTGNTVCQKSAAYILPENQAGADASPMIPDLYQGQCVPPCTSIDHCNGASYGCKPSTGLCIWPQETDCVGKQAGDHCWDDDLGQTGVCSKNLILPYVTPALGTEELYCLRPCGQNASDAPGNDALCEGIRATCGNASDAGDDASPVYNVCTPKCSQSGATYPALLALSALGLLWRRRRNRAC